MCFFSEGSLNIFDKIASPEGKSFSMNCLYILQLPEKGSSGFLLNQVFQNVCPALQQGHMSSSWAEVPFGLLLTGVNSIGSEETANATTMQMCRLV